PEFHEPLSSRTRECTVWPKSWRPGKGNSPLLLLAHLNNSSAELVVLRIESFFDRHLAQLLGADGLAADTELFHKLVPASDEVSLFLLAHAQKFFGQRYVLALGIGPGRALLRSFAPPLFF